jgi:hypothetical protein
MQSQILKVQIWNKRFVFEEELNAEYSVQLLSQRTEVIRWCRHPVHKMDDKRLFREKIVNLWK